jgi:hypothetical protein
MPNIYDLIMGSGPDAQETAQAMASRIRGQRGMGALGAVAGGGLPGLGKMTADDASEDQKTLLDASKARAQFGEEKRNLTQSLAASRNENALQKALIDANARMYGADAGLEGRMFAATLAAQAAGDRKGAARDAKTEGWVQKFAADTKDIAAMPDDLAYLQKMAQKRDIPGTGPLEGYLPNFALSQEGVDTRQAAMRLLTALLYMRSGKAVTKQEMENQLIARGLGDKATVDQFRSGTSQLERELRTAYKDFRAKYPGEAISMFHERGGGSSLKDFDKGPSIGSGEVAGADAPPVQGAFKTKSGRWAVMGADGKAVYVK